MPTSSFANFHSPPVPGFEGPLDGRESYRHQRQQQLLSPTRHEVIAAPFLDMPELAPQGLASHTTAPRDVGGATRPNTSLLDVPFSLSLVPVDASALITAAEGGNEYSMKFESDFSSLGIMPPLPCPDA
jgi:hypothetical protein